VRFHEIQRCLDVAPSSRSFALVALAASAAIPATAPVLLVVLWFISLCFAFCLA
jgi:ABC-type multidrug transport system permease subunit